jgi:hypothetical protein
MADGGPLPLEEAERRRPAHLRVDQRQQLLQVARLPGEVDASHQLDTLGSPPGAATATSNKGATCAPNSTPFSHGSCLA